jgi:hypothetical protein
MTQYQNYGVNVSPAQAKKIVDSHKNGIGCVIRLSHFDLKGNYMLPLTQLQINKLQNTTSGVDLKLSKTQLKHMEKIGGFIPLLTLIPLIAGAVGAAGGLTGGIASAVSAAKSNNEQARHNRAIEEQLKAGSGVVSDAAERIPIVGKTLSAVLKKIGLGGCGCKNLVGFKVGHGVYLEPYSTGNGVFLDPYRRV